MNTRALGAIQTDTKTGGTPLRTAPSLHGLVVRVIGAVLVMGPVAGAAGTDAGTAGGMVAIGKPAPDFALAGIDGNTHSLSAHKGKFIVLEWNNWDCPFVKKHYASGNMQGLQKSYRDKGVVWITICSSAPGKQGHYEAGEQRKRFEQNRSAATAYVLDPDGKVGRAYAAKTTPHMFVIDPEGILIYGGAIDDKPSTKTADVEGAKNFVRACLDAALAGKPVESKTSAPYGCSVKYKD